MKSLLVLILALFFVRRTHAQMHGTIVTSSMRNGGPNSYGSSNGILSHMRQSFTNSDSTATALASTSSNTNSGFDGGVFSASSFPIAGIDAGHGGFASDLTGATIGSSSANAGASGISGPGDHLNVPISQPAPVIPVCRGSDCSGAGGAYEMSSVLRPGEYVPNCGCVAVGSCQREIGHYTRIVGQYSDVVCGLNFERCCFDGPCPGVLDEFVRAAPCVPQELCLRPYGVLPTDVRDFGIIAPCPGAGAVRCITVDDVTLLEFQAAVAAIEASSMRYPENTASFVAPAPVQTVTSTSSQVSTPVAVAPPPQVSTPVAVAPPPQVYTPVAPPPQVYVEPEPVQPIAVTVPIVDTTQGQAITTTDNSFGSELATLLASAGLTSGGAGSTATTNIEPEPVSGVTTTVVSQPSIIAPPSTGFVRTPINCGYIGCYTPWAYRNYGNYGGHYPYGIGFRKSFHFSKGFGYGLF